MTQIVNTYDLARHSHQKVQAICTEQVADKCAGTYGLAYRDLRDNEERNDGNYVCFHCSRKVKYEGRNNPNCRVKNLDDAYLTEIDTAFKAYLLGWIASDGGLSSTNAITLEIHAKDIEILYKIAAELATDLTVKHDTVRERGILRICSAQMTRDVCRHLNILPESKAGVVAYPMLPDHLHQHFIRGVYDGDGSISDPRTNKKNYPVATIASTSCDLRAGCYELAAFPGHVRDDGLEYSCNNAIDFLGWLYDDADIYLERKHTLYRYWCTFVPGIGGRGTSVTFDQIKCIKTRKDAVLPSKAHVSDAGYDLTVVEMLKTVGEVEFYTTGIKVQLPFGWYCHVYPRSSISKTGYSLANSVGIIDRTYMGEIIVALRRDTGVHVPLQLPARIAQLVPFPASHLDLVEIFDEVETSRGTGGFGSTDKPKQE